MKPTRQNHPQSGPAIALAQLITEHPQLPMLNWTLHRKGNLRGALHRVTPAAAMEPTARDVLAAWAETLNASPTPPMTFWSSGDDQTLVAQHVLTTWRDVVVEIAIYAPLSEYPELLPAVAA
ncbi:hypothetical protein C7C46_08805 [Streptomyces tateyamensis]|uniref:Uncharacterized protein n=1 Tax=Streptomyces tateyamensis TaxID=565073 RepID=A0A2V4NT37_9ACTN|nr:hypothetical protein [Streptomyces tateyamensis]PYC83426.1 hypothetical protein C7C46_08805 [Streptomyces tateyamensis]